MPGAAMLAMDMGTGKSKVVVDLVCNFNFKQTLILCPKSVLSVWTRQFAEHSSRPGKVVAFDGNKSVADKVKMAAEIQQAARLKDEPLVLVFNYEACQDASFKKWALSTVWDLVVLDESHRLKAPGGKRSMFVKELGRRAKHRLALTGTPMPHSPLDIYAQYRALDPSIYGNSWTMFKNRYAIMGGYGGYEVKGYQHEDELNKKMYQIAFRVGADVLDLPPFHHVPVYCTLDPKGKRLYDDIEDELYAEVGAGQVTVANALVKLLRLQQITSGFLTDDEGSIRLVNEGKLAAFKDLLIDINPKEPLVVFCRFRHDLAAIQKIVEAEVDDDGKRVRRYAELSGARDDLASWQDGDAEVLGVQIQSGGVGIDLTRASKAVYYSLGFSLGDYEQSLKRVHRPGQTQPTTYFHLITKGTVDEKVYRALQERKDVVEAILAEARG